MRVLVAPDKFRGTLTAEQAAAAIAAGWARGDREASVETVPMADGGEGTLDALLSALGGERRRVTVTGPLGRPVEAEFGVATSAEGRIGVVEMARASGLFLVPPDKRDPKATTTRGTGELILAASKEDVDRILICIGGSGTNDGGAGMAQALGVRMLDERGRQIGAGGGALLALARIDARSIPSSVRRVGFVVATDVDNPLTGPKGATAVYGPQKGATQEDVALLDRALGHYAAVIYRDMGVDVRDMPGSGAAGGLGAGLIAFLGATVRPGVEVVMEAVRLPELLSGADLVVTGEGSFDDQSLYGKTVAGVIRAAAENAVPAIILCGRTSAASPDAPVFSMADLAGMTTAEEQPRKVLEDLAASVAARVRTEGPRLDPGLPPAARSTGGTSQ